jgi:molecular chaperone GrpE
MDENNSNQQKPLRKTSNKIKDIYDAYVKNDKTKNIPITDSDSTIDFADLSESIQNDSQVTIDKEFNLDESAFLEMHDKMEELKKILSESNTKIETLTKENAELRELSLRKTAELENFRRRSIKEKSDLIEYANEKLLTNLVEILDDLSAANNVNVNSDVAESIKKGIELVYNKAKKMFDEAGVVQMQFDENTQFDVNLHEALMMAPSNKPEGTVIQVLSNGYTMKDKVLKHAKVITSSGNSN